MAPALRDQIRRAIRAERHVAPTAPADTRRGSSSVFISHSSLSKSSRGDRYQRARAGARQNTFVTRLHASAARVPVRLAQSRGALLGNRRTWRSVAMVRDRLFVPLAVEARREESQGRVEDRAKFLLQEGEQPDEKTRPAHGAFTPDPSGCCEASALARFPRCFLITVASASEGMISLDLFRWS